MNQFIVTADDFGLSKSTNETIIEGIQKGVISSTNVMINMPFASEAKSLINRDGINVGIHLNLTTGKPVSDPSKVPTIVDKKGRFYSFLEFKKKVEKNLIDRNDLLIEINGQYDRYISQFGIPEYWNTHNHIQMFPKLYRLFVDCAKDRQVFLMRNNYKICLTGGSMKTKIKNLVIKGMYKYGKKRGMSYPDGLVCFAGSVDKLSINNYKNTKQNEIGEIMIHVTKEIDSDLFGNITDSRIKEYEFFVDGEFAEAVNHGEIIIQPFSKIEIGQ